MPHPQNKYGADLIVGPNIHKLSFPGYSSKDISVTVAMIDSRSGIKDEKNFVEQAIYSVSRQEYPISEFLIYNNTDRSKSIGYCWNKLAEAATSDWIIYFGDDDILSPVYVQSLVVSLKDALPYKSDVVRICSYCTLIDENMNVAPITKSPTGMWLRSYLLKNMFNENLNKLVDKEYIESFLSSEDKERQIIDFSNYGYIYRQHDGKVSARHEIT